MSGADMGHADAPVEQRIVSLCPSLTELVFDLGLGEALVGVTRFCVHPQEARERIEVVGGTKNPDVERIAQLRPTLVLLNEEENRIEDAEELTAGRVPIHTSMPRDVEDTAAMVRSIGAALQRQGAADRIADDILTRADRVRSQVRDARSVSFAYVIWRDPWMSANGDTFAHALLELAGGRNVFAEAPQRYPTFGLAELVRRDPELVLLCTEPYPFKDDHIDELIAATGFSSDRFRIADGEYLSWHGSRTPDGIDYAAGLLNERRRAEPESGAPEPGEAS